MSGDERNEELTALLRAHPVTPESDIQVYFTAFQRPGLVAWLAGQGLYLYQIPVDDPIPTFGIGVRLPGDEEPGEVHPGARYEASIGIRPFPGKAGRVRAVVWEHGTELWSCDHDHAPGVRDPQKILPGQRDNAVDCAVAWVNSQISSGALPPLPVVRAGS